jgi:hypothetical protein
MIGSKGQPASDSFDSTDSLNSEDLVKMTVIRLREELKSRKLRTTGDKDTLIGRLKVSLENTSLNQGENSGFLD